jgi:hypothetical protein
MAEEQLAKRGFDGVTTRTVANLAGTTSVGKKAPPRPGAAGAARVGSRMSEVSECQFG